MRVREKGRNSEGMEYMWKSSIPEKWVKLKGRKFFRKAGQEEETKDKPISPKAKTRGILPVPDPSSSITPQYLHSATFNFDPHVLLSTSVSAKSLSNHHPLDKEKTKNTGKPGFIRVLELGSVLTEHTSSVGRVHKARPKPLNAVKKKNKEEQQKSTSLIDSFLHRFDSPTLSIVQSPQSRRGVNGWKIRKIKFPVLSPAHSERRTQQAVKTQKGGEREINGNLVVYEPYLEYIRRKRDEQLIFPLE